jgi:hypothetical protein
VCRCRRRCASTRWWWRSLVRFPSVWCCADTQVW